jgi:DinB family protein
MKFNSNAILEELEAEVRQLILTASYLQKEDPELLLITPGVGKWSVIQILEHLNSYGRYYLPAIEKSLQSHKPPKENFTPGWFGNYFMRIMRPGGDGKIRNKMTSPKDHRPPANPDIKPVMNNFMNQHQQLLNLLEMAKQKNIGATRTPISISRFIKLKVGDTFRFLIAHEQRHFVQIANTIHEIQGVTGKFQSALQAIQHSPVFSHD